jgi:hypothetical protein
MHRDHHDDDTSSHIIIFSYPSLDSRIDGRVMGVTLGSLSRYVDTPS